MNHNNLKQLWIKTLENKTNTLINNTGMYVLENFLKDDFVYTSLEDIEELIDDALYYGHNTITNILIFINVCYYNGDEDLFILLEK
jgi:hypothetical protein